MNIHIDSIRWDVTIINMIHLITHLSRIQVIALLDERLIGRLALHGCIGPTLRSVARTCLQLWAQMSTRDATYDFIGYIDEVRITKGVARNRRSYKLPGLPMANF